MSDQQGILYVLACAALGAVIGAHLGRASYYVYSDYCARKQRRKS